MTNAPISIEFFADGSDDAPLVLIYGYDIARTRELFHAVRALREGREDAIAIHTLPGFHGVGGLELVFHLADKDLGLSQATEALKFDCHLNGDSWQRVEDLLAPFCDRCARPGPFQWLDETGKISLLFSTGRGW